MMDPDSSTAWRFFLIFGRILGIVPLSGLLWKSSRGIHFRGKSTATAVSTLIIFILCCLNVFTLLDIWNSGSSNVFKLIGTAAPSFAISCGILVYVFFRKNSGKLVSLMKQWTTVTKNLNFHISDASLNKDCFITFSLYFSCFLVLGVLLDLKFFGIGDVGYFGEELQNFTKLEAYYHRTMDFAAHIIPYHPLSAGVLTSYLKIVWISHFYMDMLLILILRVVQYQLYHFMRKVKEHRLVFDNGSLFHVTKELERKWWEKIADDYEAIAELVEEIAMLLSPLIFLSVFVDLFFLSLEMNFFLYLHGPASFLSKFTGAICVAHFSTRIMSISMKAGNIHSYGMSIGRLILQHCPATLLPSLTTKIERIMDLEKISLNGLGCFTITKSFVLRLVGVLLTVEVFLMQGKILL